MLLIPGLRGTKAFHDAIHRYNLDNPQTLITDKDNLIRVHKTSPIFKELKALLTHIQKEWEGKTLRLETGEVFKVKGYRRYKDKDTGELIEKPGNLLTTLSAYLQSIEVDIMSQLILRTKDEYLPLLWQHDGLTMCNWCELEIH